MTWQRAGGVALIGEINEAGVLAAVRREGETTRARIAEVTALSAPAVTTITGRLLATGLLREGKVLPSTGGRPARALALAEDGRFAIGVDLRHDSARALVVNLAGEVIDEHVVPWDGPSPDSALAGLDTVVREVLEGPRGDRVLGIGFTVSGIVRRELGLIEHSGALRWDDVRFAEMAVARWALPVAVDSLANALATGMTFGVGPSDLSSGDALIVNIDRSVGLSIVVDGHPHRGAGGRAGRMAHLRSIAAGDVECHCGRRGCLETLAARWGLERRAGSEVPSVELLGLAGDALGQALVDCVSLLDPSRVVIAHAGLLDEPAYRGALLRVYRGNELMPPMTFTQMSADSWARGAACQIVEALFDHTQRTLLGFPSAARSA